MASVSQTTSSGNRSVGMSSWTSNKKHHENAASFASLAARHRWP